MTVKNTKPQLDFRTAEAQFVTESGFEEYEDDSRKPSVAEEITFRQID